MTAAHDDPIISRYSQLARAALSGHEINDGDPDAVEDDESIPAGHAE